MITYDDDQMHGAIPFVYVGVAAAIYSHFNDAL